MNMLVAPGTRDNKFTKDAKPYCRCWHKWVKVAVPWKQLNECSCGEEHDVKEWRWQQPGETEASWVILSEQEQLVTFHPYYSSGTAAVRGDTAMKLNCHYYWEVKMLTDTYGTDIMVGLGSDKVDIAESTYKFTSLLGNTAESYGLSYTGAVRHDAKTVANESHGFCRGSIIGVRLDMWQGTLEFYINRKSQGISFYNLRRHSVLYPMVCSTAAQSSMKLVYAASWQASLLVDALKILAASATDEERMRLPPGLWYRLKTQFWLTLPTKGCVGEDDDEIDSVEKDPIKSAPNMLGELFSSQYMNGFYTDNVERNYRLVLWEDMATD